MVNQNRLFSKAAFIAIVGLIGFILGNYGLYEVLGLTSESYKTLADLVLGVLVAFGIYNNPTAKNAF